MFDKTKKLLATVTGVSGIRWLFAYIKNEVGITWARFREEVQRAKRFERHGEDDLTITHEELMARWGVDEKNKESVIFSLRLAQVLFFIPSLFVLFNLSGIVEWANPVIMLFVACSCLLTSAVYILIYEWKIRLIKNQIRFMPFLAWLFSWG